MRGADRTASGNLRASVSRMSKPCALLPPAGAGALAIPAVGVARELICCLVRTRQRINLFFYNLACARLIIRRQVSGSFGTLPSTVEIQAPVDGGIFARIRA